MLIKSILESSTIASLSPDFSALKMIPEEIAHQAQFLLFAMPKARHFQALTTNNHPEQVQEIMAKLEQQGFVIEFFYTSNEGFDLAFAWYQQLKDQQAVQVAKAQKDQKAEGKSAISLIKEYFDTRESQDPGVFIKEMIRLSFQSGASDLHFQAEEKGVLMKLRLDGVLMQVLEFGHEEFWKYMQKIKFMSGVKMNVDYLPQDGRFSFEASDSKGEKRQIDARVNFMPGVKSENVVIRFLDASETIESFEEIGFSPYHIQLLENYMKKTTGIIIVTGPTGSGKTTTLYTMLKQLNTGEKKIITLEDPIEYRISGLQQSQINYAKGYDYETGLKAILRQDPDMILIGETRTKETAQIAINAALTGHLVFTTLHTNSVFEAITRLLNMGVESYLLTPALQLLIGQRLVRKSCPHCKYESDASSEEDRLIRQFLTSFAQKNPESGLEYHGKLTRNHGCEYCNHTGYQGRIAIVEMLALNDEMREVILQDKTSKKLQELAQKAGFLALQEDGLIKVIQGLTSLEEVYRVSY